ncbi:MAG: class I SAM-dependent methyltransferase [Firmicutes bacterium]|nr:class I SAM-dependent methyltransferase [Bacillota bacterium]
MDKIQKSYKQTKNIYDKTLTRGSIWSKLYIRIFWGGVDDIKIAETLLSYIPDDFSGKLLDVPVGTAVFTHKKYKRMKNAHITCLDYSTDMLEQAKNRLPDIKMLQGDVGNMKFDDESFDIVLSMNGFHVFPDKEKAFSETYRVLKKGGVLLSCFYIKGKSKITDWLANNILAKRGWFTPPFDTEESLKARLEKLYDIKTFVVDRSIVYFYAVKKIRTGLRDCADPKKLDQKSNFWRSVFLWQNTLLSLRKK